MLQPTFSLRTKIILLVSGIAFCTALIIGGLNYYGISKIAADSAIEKLAGETRLAALGVRRGYDELKNDAFVISRTPPVEGLIYCMRNHGIDPRDGTSQENWHRRLDTIFAAMIKGRPHYTQIRFIGIADNGRELVRVNRHPDGRIESVEPASMQEKAGELYFREGEKLQQDGYSREEGKIDPSLISTLRLVTPLFDDQHKRFGMIVINVNYELFLTSALQNLNINEEIFVSDDNGNYIHKQKGSAIGKLQVAQVNSPDAPDFIKAFVSNKTGDGRFAAEGLVGYRHRLQIAPAHSKASIGSFILVPGSELFAGTNAILNQSLMTGGILVLAASLAAALASGRIMGPIARMTAQMRTLGQDGELDVAYLPLQRGDELGEMARAFHESVMRLKLSNALRAKMSLQLEAFIDNAVDGFVIIDRRGIIEKANPAVLTLFGYEREELVGRNVGMLMPDAMHTNHDAFLQTYQESHKRNYIGTIRDEQARHKDGTIFPIALSISELQFMGRSVFTGIIRGTTSVENARHEIARYAAELERSNQELEQFAYIASHDLKAPLRVIDNTSRWLEEDLAGKLTADDRDNMRLMRSRVKRMEKLLDDLLEYSRVGKADDGRFRELVQGGMIADDVVVLLAPAPAMKVKFSSAFKAILVNRMPLQQVLYNLVNNAIKDHDRESGSIEIDVTQSETEFRFTVRDDGPGIPMEFQEKIFEMFHTLKPRDQVEGSGMGLAFVKKTVERAGGAVTVRSEGGRGSEFTVIWPRKQPATDQAAERAA